MERAWTVTSSSGRRIRSPWPSPMQTLERSRAPHHRQEEGRGLGGRGERNDRMECRGGVSYEVSFQLEPVTPEVFWTFQQELAQNGERQGLLHTFDASGRMALGALSYIHVETRSRSMLVQAFHTFPDDFAIVKSQSMFQVG